MSLTEIELPDDEAFAAWKAQQERKKLERRQLTQHLRPAAEVDLGVNALEKALAAFFSEETNQT